MEVELTSTQVLAAASEVLGVSGYAEALLSSDDSAQLLVSRVFEDPYGIVAIAIFDSWNQLVDGWHIAQGELVDLMSAKLRRPEPKAWEGYLVLMTPSFIPVGERADINAMRADTNRVRKLVAAADELGTLDDVRTFLLPLLPLGLDDSLSGEADLLESLPELLDQQGVPLRVTEAVLAAFAENESILQRLHVLGSSK